jgi:threonine 3-dehydrogenase
VKGKMKALVKEAAGPGAVLRSVDIPEPGPFDVLVKVNATSICGTDLHIYKWDQWAASRIKPPVVIGHEMAGEVVAVGDAVTRCRRGDYVSMECHQTCGHCYQCQTGQGHICSDYSILGVDFNGCFAEYASVPEGNLWPNDPVLPPEFACLQDPVGNAVLAVMSAPVTGQTVLITGCGAIGLFAVGVAKAAGAAKIFAVDLNRYRLKIAQQMGAAAAINPHTEAVVPTVLAGTAGRGVDVFVEMSGSEQCLHDGLELLRNGGHAALLGLPAQHVTLDLANEIIFKGITVAGVTGRKIFDTWYTTSALLKGVLDISPVITHKMKLDQFESAFDIMQTGECGKIILYP